ncbi:MAG: GDP-mannose 4,6-dehydratase [bacterium]|nr:GDP-mannose 4,6-dehydratase [bacterium]
MKCLITGVAGFIGSHLAEKLVELGYQVVGIDCFTDYYPRAIKERNLANLLNQKQFTFIEANLVSVRAEDFQPLLDVDYIFHQAAQAGVRASWGTTFASYTENNILATQRLLEAIKTYQPSNLKRLIYASSSSIYGDTDILPMKEDNRLQPISPYGVTKLAAEHLCYLYWKNFGIPTVSLRYFTVYGPRQRPDMAFHKFITAMLKQEPVIIYDDGNQTRDFTYIADIIHGNILAMEKGRPGQAYNLGGGHRVTLNDLLDLLDELIGMKSKRVYQEKQKGDVRDTLADTTKANIELGFQPSFDLKQGLTNQIESIKKANPNDKTQISNKSLNQ